MARGRIVPNTELENLAAGLGQAEDPYMIADLMSLGLPELADMVRMELRYTAVSMMRGGRIFMAIKKKLGHGEWESFIDEQTWNWAYVRASMKLLEVVARFPQALHLAPGKTTHALLRLPMSEIAAVMEGLPAKALEKLTPWDLEQIYQKKVGENRKAKPRKERLMPADEDLPTPIDSLSAQALSALRQIAELKLTKPEYARAERYWEEISAAWDRASYNLRDPEHKTEPIWESMPSAESEFGAGSDA